MIENFNLNLLAGGCHRATPSWNKESDRFDQCYKCYLPTRGKALVETADGAYTIAPGRLYFIPGCHLRRQYCEREMLVHWVHFMPESYYLHHRLSSLRSVVSWPLRNMQWLKADFLRIGEIFDEPESDRNRPRQNPSLALVCRIEAILMYLVADILGSEGRKIDSGGEPELVQLKPAIDFMDNYFRSNPSLAEVAGKAHLAANYFHRLFKRNTGITPFEYMEQKRLYEARRLLGDWRLSIKQVAEQSGYDNPLYFSRVFRRHFGLPPSAFQRTMMP
ncbi:MAG: AraC family transcriptional regulator [Verrucomicrobiota bacterium]